MSTQYRIGEFFVDLSRNQISKREQSQTLAPKALAVLTCLAKNQGNVVSYDELLSIVWQDTVVTPNTLQRSIAQLRKALGENSKVQSYIKTHAKQGYSLECDVQWQMEKELQRPQEDAFEIESDEKIESNPESRAEVIKCSTNKTDPSRTKPKLISAIIAIVILSIIGLMYFAPEKNSLLTFDKLRPLTATDDKEFDPTYTPDGKYIVFHRYIDKLCSNNVWAKNIATQQEFQLTKEIGSYGSHSFSKDGKNLIFVATEDCRQPITQKNCYNLVSLDFEKALKSPQEPNLIMQCKHSKLNNPIWLNNNDIAVMQKESNRWKLINYSISQNKTTDLFDPLNGNLISFAYSTSEDIFAVTAIHNDGLYYIDMLKADGTTLSSNLIERSEKIPKFRFIYPSFSPLKEQLVFSTGRQFFSLSYNGKITQISLPFGEWMSDPKFHPDGKRLLMIKGRYDSDIAVIPLIHPTQDNPLWQIDKNRSYVSLERSILGEDDAIFQPEGETIAFISERSGGYQLWITNDNGAHQLTTFPLDTNIYGINWAADGKSILVNANKVLSQVFLDASQKTFSFEYPIVRLFQWDSENNTALLMTRIQGISQLVEYNFIDSTFRIITNKQVQWANKSEDGQLIYTDQLDRFWQPGPAEDQLIEPLNGLNALKRFVIKDNVIFAVNSERQLWSYNLNKRTFKILRDIHEDVDYLTDVNQSQALVTLRISAKKEVVELSVSK